MNLPDLRPPSMQSLVALTAVVALLLPPPAGEAAAGAPRERVG